MPELITTGGLKGLGVELGEMLDRLLDGGLNAVLSAQVSERFTGNSWAKGVKSLDQTPESEVGDDLGGDFADGSKRAGVGLPRGHGCQVHVQSNRWPK